MAQLVVESSRTGRINESGDPGEAYLTVQQKATGDSVADDGTTLQIGQEGVLLAGQEEYEVYRAVADFSLSSLPVNADITSVLLSLYHTAIYLSSDFDVTLVSAADIGATLVAADYGDLLDDTVSRGSITASTLVLDSYNDITLNATGVADILTAAGGTFRIAFRSSRDISQTSPGVGATGVYHTEAAIFSGHSVTNKKPKLTINYVPFIPKIFYF